MNQNNTLPIPAVPVELRIKVDQYNAAAISVMIFIAILAALLVFGFVFKR